LPEIVVLAMVALSLLKIPPPPLPAIAPVTALPETVLLSISNPP